jgi:hypothetical protein
MRPIHLLAALCSAVLLAACATADITVTPAGRNLGLAARKVDCVVEFHRTRAPDRPFDEVATLHLEGKHVDAWEAQERMRRRACELGADAVVVTRDYVAVPGPTTVTAGPLGPMVSRGADRVLMTGAAVSYPDVRADPAARLARDARGLADLMPPRGFSVATARTTTPLRGGPDVGSTTDGDIAGGTAIWAVQANGGWCRARHADGRQGWVDCAALVFGAPRAEEKQPAAAPAPAGPTPTSI